MTSHSLKRQAKSILQAMLPSRIAPILVASMGRSGSTVAYKTLCEAMANARFPFSPQMGRRLVSDAAWYPASTVLRPGVVYKTHALADEMPQGSAARVVFLYRRPSDVVLSVLSCEARYGQEWIRQHLEHLRASGGLDDLFTRDVLRLEEQLDGWLGDVPTDVLGLRYEDLWENTDTLSEFVKLKISLPRKTSPEGATDLDADVVERVREAYARLDEKVDRLPSVHLTRTKMVG